MTFEQKINNYIELVLTVGINIHEGDNVYLKINTHLDWFATSLVKRAYELGAREVITTFRHDELERVRYDHASDEVLTNVYPEQVERDKLFAEQNFKLISVASPNPYAMEGVDSKKIQMEMAAYLEKCYRMKKNTTSNLNTWCVIACANQKWADYATDGDLDKLWEMIFTATRANQDNPTELWNEHIERLSQIAETLNNSNFDYLHFENSLGTDLKVGLVKEHIWTAAGDMNSRLNQKFVPNIPTEEVFTMPDKYSVNGRVVASKPLNNNGQIIDDFWIEFKDGAVEQYEAQVGKSALEAIITTDEGSKYLGEVALVSKTSPINQMNQLFYNTLFDENSSCHLALGNAYPTNIVGGVEMDNEVKEQNHVNVSKEHVDFMFGTEDMKITGYTASSSQVIFEDGDFKL
ncbi:aminopeptidase [Mollicutes bacterium LVI A0039]|nr:aminopeptidase [Mollicutes bacterium LVI A0039]